MQLKIVCWLNGANLLWADLTHANLTGATLKEALYCSHTKWPKGFDHRTIKAHCIGPNSSLSGVDLRFRCLYEAELVGADLSEAKLDGVNLRLAQLEGANLSDADLSNADLSGAYLNNADLRGAILEGTILEGIESNDQTRWPRSFNIDRLT